MTEGLNCYFANANEVVQQAIDFELIFVSYLYSVFNGYGFFYAINYARGDSASALIIYILIKNDENLTVRLSLNAKPFLFFVEKRQRKKEKNTKTKQRV